MALQKKLLVIIIIPVIICLSQKRYSVAGEDWQLNDNLTEISDADEIELGKQVDAYIRRQFEMKTIRAQHCCERHYTKTCYCV